MKSADCGLYFKCFNFATTYWSTSIQDNANTNLWCENYCKYDDIDNTYSGTVSDRCYCRTTTAPSSQQKPEEECTSKCPGKLSEICGRSSNRATVYKIDRTPEPVTTKITQMTTATSLATEEMPTTTSTEMTTTDTSPEKATTESFRTSSENLPYSISTVTSHTSTYTNTDVALSTTDRVNQTKMLCECPKSLVNTKWHFLDEMDINRLRSNRNNPPTFLSEYITRNDCGQKSSNKRGSKEDLSS
ncbi:Hypothetical predicted protein [Mytilus galloprovincialis]|uniref:WSC domain-containing protein n=1 Tax=Mytilus galloprovincialis TaxID=29158 RepID=A0A8B6FS52_MYTGA|nr:Hypothetical predicted protein [Mytilus galloprovincialis]